MARAVRSVQTSSEESSSSSESDVATQDSGPEDALREAQKENFRLQQELKALKLEIATLAVESKSTSKRRKSKNATISEDIKSNDDEIARLARKYSLMVAPWVESSTFDNLKGRPDVDPNDEGRYKDNTSKTNATIAELYDFVPENLHSLMEKHSHFSSTFRNQCQGMRSNAIFAVRQKAGLLFNMSQAYFETEFDRSQVPELQELLKGRHDHEDYALLARVLFSDCKYDLTMTNLFKNPVLPKITKTILFGKSGSKKSRPQTVAEIWKVTEATPGLIAFTAVLARFLLSPEEELRPTGKITKINWQEDFDAYKKILLGKSKKVKSVFRFFNENVFGGSATNVSSTADEKDNTEELEDAIRAINDDDSDETETDVESNLLDGVEKITTATGTLDIEERDEDTLLPASASAAAAATSTTTSDSELAMQPSVKSTATSRAEPRPAETPSTAQEGTDVIEDRGVANGGTDSATNKSKKSKTKSSNGVVATRQKSTRTQRRQLEEEDA